MAGHRAVIASGRPQVMTGDAAVLIEKFWRGAVAAVSGRRVVADALARDPPFRPDLIVAIGKAAASMCCGAISRIPTFGRAIVVTRHGNLDPALSAYPNVQVIEAGHPVPDEASLRAGAVVLEAVRGQPADASLLLLISGGASALAEVLHPDWDLTAWREMTARLIASGQSIAAINRQRIAVSLIKGGKLLSAFQGREARVYAISDVEGDDLATIGSGVGDVSQADCAVLTRIAASNARARDHCAVEAAAAGLSVRCNEESLYDDVFLLAPRIARTLTTGKPGIYIWGGEPTIRLPATPGQGGRNQSLALAIGREIAGHGNITVIVAGTDGSDGSTEAAGAIIGGDTFADPAAGQRALLAADAGSYLAEREGLFVTGPTDTNVMDLVVALVR